MRAPAAGFSSRAVAAIRDGRIKGLAISSKQRFSYFPDIPTFRELGYEDLVTATWFGFSGPAKLPPDITRALGREITNILQQPDVQKRMAQDEIARITYYSRKLLPVARKARLRHPQKVSKILRAILNLLEHRYPNVKATADFRNSTLLPGSRADLDQLFGILLWNAFEAVATGGRVRVKAVERSRAHTRPGIYVVIGDTGKGTSAEVKAHLFEPFFSTKSTTGLGLGLWIASGIVEQYGGRIRVRSSDSPAHQGTVVSVFLPF